MPAEQYTVRLEELKRLADDPAAQVAYAERLLDKERNVDVVLAAVGVLAERQEIAMRPALLRRYAYCEANPARRDPGGTVRVAILRALHPIAQHDDIPLLERAAAAYEFLYGEVAFDLRAAALIVLNELDPRRAGFHCVRLLGDQYTWVMTGEPALTAVRVLAEQGQPLPLYAHLIHDEEPNPGVVAECLRNLTPLPAALLPELIDKYRNANSEVVLLGLFELLLAHPAQDAYVDLVFDFLRTTRLYNLYRYLLITLINRRDPQVLDQLYDLADSETDRNKSEIWHEVRELL